VRTPLAWFNLVHNKTRTVVAVAGVAFSVVLIFMQLGFHGSVEKTATVVYDALQFDAVLRSREYLHVADPRSFPQARLHQAESVTGVSTIVPFYVDLNQWRNPITGRNRGILVMGVRPGDDVFAKTELHDKAVLLGRDDSLLIDRRSRREFGPKNKRQFSDEDLGVESEVGQRQVRIVGHFGLGTGLAADGAVLMNERGFCRVFPGRTVDRVSLALIRVGDGTDAAEVVDRLRQTLPGDVEVLTRGDVIEFEKNRWVNETSIGLIFRLGVVVAFIVGMAIVYQVLSSDVAGHLPEYATLKAMGYGNRYLSTVVLQQAAMLAVLGFVPALAVSEILYRITSYYANVPVEMNPRRILFVFALAVAMCAVSGIGALRKARTADPADLF